MKAIIRPDSLETARAELRRLGAGGTPVAGGTSAVFLRGDENKIGVDLLHLGLGGIRERDGQFEVGAAARIADLRAHAAEGWVLDRVAARFVTQQVRNLATLGGNVVRVFAWSDFPVALLALDASFVIRGESERQVPAREFFGGQPARLFAVGDLLTAVQVPAVRAPCGFGYRKMTRTAADYSLVTAAAWVRLDGSSIAETRVAIGASVPMPRRCPEVESALVGASGAAFDARAAAARVEPGSVRRAHAGMSDEYVRQMTVVAIADALSDAVSAAKGGAR